MLEFRRSSATIFPSAFQAANPEEHPPVETALQLLPTERHRCDVGEGLSRRVGAFFAYPAGILPQGGGFLGVPCGSERGEARVLRVFCRDEPRGIQHIFLGHHCGGGSIRAVVDVRIKRCEFNGCVDGGSGGSSDEQGDSHSTGGHLAAYLLHPVQGRGNQSADADDVGADLDRFVQKRRRRDHHAQVGNIESAAGQYYGGNVLAYVVDVSLDSGDEELGLAPDSFSTLHVWLEHGHCFPHYPGGLDDLREKHPSIAE